VAIRGDPYADRRRPKRIRAFTFIPAFTENRCAPAAVLVTLLMFVMLLSRHLISFFGSCGAIYKMAKTAVTDVVDRYQRCDQEETLNGSLIREARYPRKSNTSISRVITNAALINTLRRVSPTRFQESQQRGVF
jgi:hypothetical protein